MRLFSRRTVVCQEWVELVTEYLEGALPRKLVRAIDRHLAGCEHCMEYLAQMRRTIGILGAIPADDVVPSDMLDVLQLAYDEYLAGGGDPD